MDGSAAADVTLDRLHEIADAIGQGRFQPGEVGTWGCDVCAPDGLGTFEVNQRRIEWSGFLDDDDSPVGRRQNALWPTGDDPRRIAEKLDAEDEEHPQRQ